MGRTWDHDKMFIVIISNLNSISVVFPVSVAPISSLFHIERTLVYRNTEE